MGWITNVTTWAKKLWQHPTTAAVANYSSKTVEYVFEQISVIPKMVRSIKDHQPLRTVAGHLLRITAEDLAPLILVTYVNHLIQTSGRAYLEDEPDNAWISTDTAIQTGLYLLQAATWAYSVRAKTQMLLRTTIVTIETPPILKRIKTSQPMSVCIDEQCSTLRIKQGDIRDLVAYWSTEAAISLVGYVPAVGGPLAAVLSVYHRGRYVLTVVLPEVCNRHQVIYLREHSELALSLGIGHAGSSWLINSLVETTTGIPPVFYNSAIEQFMLITQMGISSHLQLPTAKKESSRRLLDPVLYYQNLVGFAFDIGLLGLKVKIPRMLNNQQPGNYKDILLHPSWSTIIHTVEKMHKNRLVKIMLPRLLHDAQSFIHDPIIIYHWPGFQAAIVNALETILSQNTNLLIRASSSVPSLTSALIEAASGTPKYVTKLLLLVIMDKEIIELLQTCCHEIKKLQLDTVALDDDEGELILPEQLCTQPPITLPPLIPLDSPPLLAPLSLVLYPNIDMVDNHFTETIPTPRGQNPRYRLFTHNASINPGNELIDDSAEAENDWVDVDEQRLTLGNEVCSS